MRFENVQEGMNLKFYSCSNLFLMLYGRCIRKWFWTTVSLDSIDWCWINSWLSLHAHRRYWQFSTSLKLYLFILLILCSKLITVNSMFSVFPWIQLILLHVSWLVTRTLRRPLCMRMFPDVSVSYCWLEKCLFHFYSLLGDIWSWKESQWDGRLVAHIHDTPQSSSDTDLYDRCHHCASGTWRPSSNVTRTRFGEGLFFVTSRKLIMTMSFERRQISMSFWLLRDRICFGPTDSTQYTWYICSTP